MVKNVAKSYLIDKRSEFPIFWRSYSSNNYGDWFNITYDSLKFNDGSIGPHIIKEIKAIAGKLKIGDSVTIIESLNIIQKNVGGTLNSISEICNDDFVLKKLNLKIVSGDKVAIVGDNGSGKSTFMKLLCGFYSEYQSEIFIKDIE